MSIAALAAPPAQAAAAGFDLGRLGALPGNEALRIVLALTALGLAPTILLATTSFMRCAVVLTFLRNALGTQNMPPTQVLMGLALFLTAAVMAPVGQELWSEAVGPYLEGEMEAGPAVSRGFAPLRAFMLRQTRTEDLKLFYRISRAPRPERPDQVQAHLLMPAFVVSEMRTAFEMGFVLYIPFLLVDLVVASVLMAMGMVMVPPAMISMPIKIMLFVLADGWNVLVGSLVRSFS